MIDRLLLQVGGRLLMVRLLSWNVRGLNDNVKRALLRSVLRGWKCDLVCLQEMKLENIELADVRSVWGSQSVGYSVLRATGAAGGILVLWDTNTFQLISSSCGEFSITCILQMGDDSFSWAFTGVYGPHTRGDKLRMLEELGRVRDGWSGPWCLGGDFNEILYAYERNTGVCSSNVMSELRDFINQKAWLTFR